MASTFDDAIIRDPTKVFGLKNNRQLFDEYAKEVAFVVVNHYLNLFLIGTSNLDECSRFFLKRETDDPIYCLYIIKNFQVSLPLSEKNAAIGTKAIKVTRNSEVSAAQCFDSPADFKGKISEYCENFLKEACNNDKYAQLPHLVFKERSDMLDTSSVEVFPLNISVADETSRMSTPVIQLFPTGAYQVLDVDNNLKECVTYKAFVWKNNTVTLTTIFQNDENFEKRQTKALANFNKGNNEMVYYLPLQVYHHLQSVTDEGNTDGSVIVQPFEWKSIIEKPISKKTLKQRSIMATYKKILETTRKKLVEKTTAARSSYISTLEATLKETFDREEGTFGLQAMKILLKYVWVCCFPQNMPSLPVTSDELTLLAKICLVQVEDVPEDTQKPWMQCTIMLLSFLCYAKDSFYNSSYMTRNEGLDSITGLFYEDVNSSVPKKVPFDQNLQWLVKSIKHGALVFETFVRKTISPIPIGNAQYIFSQKEIGEDYEIMVKTIGFNKLYYTTDNFLVEGILTANFQMDHYFNAADEMRTNLENFFKMIEKVSNYQFNDTFRCMNLKLLSRYTPNEHFPFVQCKFSPPNSEIKLTTEVNYRIPSSPVSLEFNNDQGKVNKTMFKVVKNYRHNQSDTKSDDLIKLIISYFASSERSDVLSVLTQVDRIVKQPSGFLTCRTLTILNLLMEHYVGTENLQDRLQQIVDNMRIKDKYGLLLRMNYNGELPYNFVDNSDEIRLTDKQLHIMKSVKETNDVNSLEVVKEKIAGYVASKKTDECLDYISKIINSVTEFSNSAKQQLSLKVDASQLKKVSEAAAENVEDTSLFIKLLDISKLDLPPLGKAYCYVCSILKLQGVDAAKHFIAVVNQHIRLKRTETGRDPSTDDFFKQWPGLNTTSSREIGTLVTISQNVEDNLVRTPMDVDDESLEGSEDRITRRADEDIGRSASRLRTEPSALRGLSGGGGPVSSV